MALTKEKIKRIYGEANPAKMSFLNKIRMLFLHPGEFFSGVKNENLKPAFTMFLVFFLISNVATVAFPFSSAGTLIVLGIFTLLSLLIIILISFAFNLFFFTWTHIFVILLGGKKGITQTFKALMYASVPVTIVGIILSPVLTGTGTITGFGASPSLLLDPAVLFELGIISIIALILFIWAIYLDGLGLGKLHGFGTGKGVGAVIISWIVLFVILVVLLSFFIRL